MRLHEAFDHAAHQGRILELARADDSDAGHAAPPFLGDST